MSLRREINGNLKVRRRTKQFVTPMLQQPLMHISNGKSYFIDACVTTVGYPQVVYIFDNIDYEPLKMDIYKLQNHHCFVDMDYGDDTKEVQVFMNIPEEFRKDFDKYIKGHYSEFGDEYKALLVKRYGEGRQEGFNTTDGLPNLSMMDIINPNDDVKKRLAESLSSRWNKIDWKTINEVLDPPNMKYEIFKTVDELREEDSGVK